VEENRRKIKGSRAESGARPSDVPSAASVRAVQDCRAEKRIISLGGLSKSVEYSRPLSGFGDERCRKDLAAGSRLPSIESIERSRESRVNEAQSRAITRSEADWRG